MAGRYERKDHFYKKAKSEGVRSRAHFKLEELDKKYHLIKSGDYVLDLGAWPGGWLEYISRRVGEKGLGVGIDLAAIEGFSGTNIKVITGDVRDEECLRTAMAFAPHGFNAVLSDLSPKLSGIKEADRAAAAGLAETALWIAGQCLREGGSFVAKVFMSAEAQQFVQQVRSMFNVCKREELQSSRKTSTEFYVVGVGFKGS